MREWRPEDAQLPVAQASSLEQELSISHCHCAITESLWSSGMTFKECHCFLLLSSIIFYCSAMFIRRNNLKMSLYKLKYLYITMIDIYKNIEKYMKF